MCAEILWLAKILLDKIFLRSGRQVERLCLLPADFQNPVLTFVVVLGRNYHVRVPK